MALSSSILNAIGNTALIRLDRFTADLGFAILAKAEYMNPGGSVKDRPALAAIEAGEAAGELTADRPVVELTSGNMGTGLALVCGVKGYRFIAVMSEGNSPERARHTMALGAEVIRVPQAPGSPPNSVSGADLALVEDRTQALVKELSAWRPNQFYSKAGFRTHEVNTGEEIWRQCGGKVDAFCTSVGTGATFVGVSRALKRHDAKIRCFPVEPEGCAPLAGQPVTRASHPIQGTAYAAVPPLWEADLADGFLHVTDQEVFTTARRLATVEGLLVGFSAAANVAAAVQLGGQLGRGVTIATILCDAGWKYFSTELFAP